MIADGGGPPEGIKKYLMVAITYLSCAAFHASREGFVAVKANFQSHLRFPTQLLGLMDTTFLVFYGTGLLFSGSIGARYGNKLVACVGLTGRAGGTVHVMLQETQQAIEDTQYGP
jgi:sugar phosphate permease